MDTISGIRVKYECGECSKKPDATCHKCGGTGTYEGWIDPSELFSSYFEDNVKWIAEDKAQKAIEYEKLSKY